MTATTEIVRRPISFLGAEGNRLAGDDYRSVGQSRGTAVLLHGGGQTRHSWRGTARTLAADGFRALAMDQRGHGESDWVESGDYDFATYADDLRTICAQIQAEDRASPIVIGASLGGIAALMAAGEHGNAAISALVLVDITPRIKPDGVDRILRFMAANADEGFASLEEASDVIAEYLPHRPRPANRSGLAKNLRLGEDGRYRWHWDPRFLVSRQDSYAHADEIQRRLKSAARHLKLPILLVRGRESELVGEDEAREFLALVPHARLADVSGARHMVVGDKNDVFTKAVTGFIAARNGS